MFPYLSSSIHQKNLVGSRLQMCLDCLSNFTIQHIECSLSFCSFYFINFSIEFYHRKINFSMNFSSYFTNFSIRFGFHFHNFSILIYTTCTSQKIRHKKSVRWICKLSCSSSHGLNIFIFFFNQSCPPASYKLYSAEMFHVEHSIPISRTHNNRCPV